MHVSVMTSKGQTTILKEIRNFLHLKPKDKMVFIPDGKRMFFTHVKGDILDLKGAIKYSAKKPIDFRGLRERTKEKVAKEVMKGM